MARHGLKSTNNNSKHLFVAIIVGFKCTLAGHGKLSICCPGSISASLMHIHIAYTLSCRMPGRGPLALRRVGAAPYNSAAKSGSDRRMHAGCCRPAAARRLLQSHRRAGRARQAAEVPELPASPTAASDWAAEKSRHTLHGRPALQFYLLSYTLKFL
jgi:hypothetical protein